MYRGNSTLFLFPDKAMKSFFRPSFHLFSNDNYVVKFLLFCYIAVIQRTD